MSLTEPIVEGAYYEREDGQVVGPPARHSIEGLDVWTLDDWCYMENGAAFADHAPRLKRRVYLVPTDPAEVVAELRERSCEAQQRSSRGYGDAPSYHSGREEAYDRAADLVASKLGVSET